MTIEDYTVARLKEVKTKMEVRLAQAVDVEMAYFRDRYGFNPSHISVDLSNVTTMGGPIEYVVSGVKVELPVEL